MVFERPLRATHHCRHYSYNNPISHPQAGPQCAVGCVFDEPGSIGRCMPEPRGECSKREEYTDAEREAWEAAKHASMERLCNAVQALPEAIPLRSGGNIECPNCGGTLRFDRWHGGAEIKCSTPHCCEAHFSIAAGRDWPSRKAKP